MKLTYLSTLLPYNSDNKSQERLKDGINEYLLLITATEEAIEAFTRNELNKFDPLVGENSCQIRAVKIALLASQKKLITQSLLSNIAFSKASLVKLLQKLPDPSIQEKSLNKILTELNIDVSLNSDILFLIKSYILTKTKTSLGTNEIIKFYKNEKTQAKLIRALGNVGSRFADDLVRHLRELLSKSSVNFVHHITKCPHLNDESIGPIITNLTISHRGLHCAPFYWMTKLIMHQALIARIPIAVFAEQFAQDLEYKVLKKTKLLFYPTELGYKVKEEKELEVDKPVIVIKVASCKNASDFSDINKWKKELTEYSLLDLVLACNAAHRQYPDPLQDHKVMKIKDENYHYHLAKSKEWGCHIENPSRFFLTHMYCDNTKNI